MYLTWVSRLALGSTRSSGWLAIVPLMELHTSNEFAKKKKSKTHPGYATRVESSECSWESEGMGLKRDVQVQGVICEVLVPVRKSPGSLSQ